MISKPGTNFKRLLGTPTIDDRAKQSLAKLALEFQGEALFEFNSYSFRPDPKFANASWRIRYKLKYDACWVFDRDIKKYFDNINYKILLEKLSSTFEIENQVKAWLEAGIFEKRYTIFQLR